MSRGDANRVAGSAGSNVRTVVEPDELPEDLDAASAYVGPYSFPDIARRRIAGVIYLVLAIAMAAIWFVRGAGVLVNSGFAVVAVVGVVVAAYHFAAGWHLEVSDGEALIAAGRVVGFPVGHASAQLAWRGLRSRPTWRILVYSAEDRPERRGLVLVDGVDGAVLEHFVEDNPEDWPETGPETGRT